MADDAREPGCCPVFGVGSRVPIIGLGLMLILFAIVPVLILPAGMMPVPVPVIMAGFGTFLIWIGLTK